MKKLILLSALAFSFSAFIPASTNAQAMEQKKMDKMKDGSVMMKDNKMMVMKGGNWVPMDKDMTMTNGTKVSTDGTVTMKDGTKKTLANGDCVKPDGMIHKDKMDKKM